MIMFIYFHLNQILYHDSICCSMLTSYIDSPTTHFQYLELYLKGRQKSFCNDVQNICVACYDLNIRAKGK
jgi:hypothetical protein